MANDINEVLVQLLRQSGARHRVLTSNIANVDTPNYKAKDIKFSQVLGSEITLATTNSKHLPSAESNAAGEVTVEDTQPWLDKNNVEMDLEVAKMTENAMRQQAEVTLLTMRKAMFRSAMRTS